jgi:hypothetical protein
MDPIYVPLLSAQAGAMIGSASSIYNPFPSEDRRATRKDSSSHNAGIGGNET